MIDYNKNVSQSANDISVHCAIRKRTTQKIRLTKVNKNFLKLIGLLK